uniref:Uncharacterized protein n=1 Tax=Tanacetum cinerariifolium TaxID=118510 RepID=A0A6L2KVR2_TANCI|nr:hypothetical protein [Tanacetum cinerariifolium]
MHIGSSWIRRNVELTLKSFVKFSRFVPDSSIKILLNHHLKMNWFYLSRNSVTLEDFMFQANNRELSSARKEHMPYLKFAKAIINHFISKDNTIFMRKIINLHTICDDTLLDILKFISKAQDYQQYRALIPDDIINQDIKDSKAYKTYLDFATRKDTPKKARKFKKVVSPLRKLLLVLEEEPAVKPKQAKRPTKKSIIVPTTSVMELVPNQRFSDEQEEKTTGIDEGSGTKPGVLDVPKYLSKNENESWGDSGDDESNDDDSDEVTKDDDDDVESNTDGDKEVSDDEKTSSNEDENPNLNQNDDEEEEHEEEYVRTPDSIEFTDDEEKYEELYKDVNTTYEQVKDDEHVIFTTVHDTQKTEDSLQDTKVISMMNVKVRHEEPTTETPPLLNIPVMVILETSSAAGSTIPLTILPITPLQQQSTPTPTPAPTNATSILALLDFSSLFRFDQRVSALEKELSQLKQADYSIQKVNRIEALKNTKISTMHWSNLTSSTRTSSNLMKTSKDTEPSRGSKSNESNSSSSKGSKSQPKSSGKSDQAEEPMFETRDTKMQLNQGEDLGHEYPFDLSKPLPLIEDQGRQVVLANYFFNNDLEYQKGRSSSSKYTTSTTKTNAAKYDNIDGIKDMVPSLWSPIKVAYDKYAMWGITHWGPKQQRFYGYTSNKKSKHDVFSTKRIIVVTHVKVMKWYDYGYLEEIKVQKEDQQLYKFREGDFHRLNLHDIEDMLLLLVQKKLFNLERDVIYDLNVALWMFTKCVVILKRVEDL